MCKNTHTQSEQMYLYERIHATAITSTAVIPTLVNDFGIRHGFRLKCY